MSKCQTYGVIKDINSIAEQPEINCHYQTPATKTMNKVLFTVLSDKVAGLSFVYNIESLIIIFLARTELQSLGISV